MGRTWMSEQETRRAGVLERVKAGELKQIEAATMLVELPANQAVVCALPARRSGGVGAR